MHTEDTLVTHKSTNPRGAFLNAKARTEEALETHRDFFESDAHLDRLDAVAKIVFDFFGRRPNYFNPRGLGGRRPFEAVKIADCGYFLNRKTSKERQEMLYAPLEALGNVEVKRTINGDLLIRVYKS